MAVYKKENPAFLEESIQSILRQTLKTDDFVLVCDGPLTNELDKVIQYFESKYFELFNVLRLPENKGLGTALRIGIPECKNELIARMDSDDVSAFNRCELQVNYFNRYPNCDVLSGTIAEFTDNPKNVVLYKKLPIDHNDLIKYSKYRSPINHPCVMYKKTKVLSAGSYQDFYYLEDYYLWIRMIQKNCMFYNLPDLLLYMRADCDMYRRRGGWSYSKSRALLNVFKYKNSFINLGDFLFLLFSQSFVSIIPVSLRVKIYQKYLRDTKL